MCVCAVAELPPRDGPAAGLTQRGANILARSCTCAGSGPRDIKRKERNIKSGAADCKTSHGEWNGWRREHFLRHFWPPCLNVWTFRKTFPTSSKFYRSRVTETPEFFYPYPNERLMECFREKFSSTLHTHLTYYTLKTLHWLCCDKVNTFCQF